MSQRKRGKYVLDDGEREEERRPKIAEAAEGSQGVFGEAMHGSGSGRGWGGQSMRKSPLNGGQANACLTPHHQQKAHIAGRRRMEGAGRHLLQRHAMSCLLVAVL